MTYIHVKDESFGILRLGLGITLFFGAAEGGICTSEYEGWSQDLRTCIWKVCEGS